MIPGSIRHYLMFSNPEAQQLKIRNALELVGLDAMIDKFPNGLDTLVSADGWPMSLEQCLRLKLAAVTLADPAVVVLDQIVDLVNNKILQNYIRYLQTLNTTVVYFTRRDDISLFTRTLDLESGS